MGGRFKVLITGIDGFTGRHLKNSLEGYDCIGLKSDLLDTIALESEILNVKPNYVVHLAAIAFAGDLNVPKIYNVNVVGTLNLLAALSKMEVPPKKVVLASSGSVYGNAVSGSIDENTTAKPVNHYGCSKLSMEHMSRLYGDRYPIIITRPFNYTGRGHSENFLIPKIVKAYKSSDSTIELGNLDVFREFNDVRDVCSIYRLLLELDSKSLTVNICSGKSISLLEVIELMDSIVGVKMNIKINPLYVRENEIKNLSGNTFKMKSLTSYDFKYSFEETLRWMM